MSLNVKTHLHHVASQAIIHVTPVIVTGQVEHNMSQEVTRESVTFIGAYCYERSSRGH